MALLSPIYFFSNDLILFGECSTIQIETVFDYLNMFCASSDSKVSTHKTKIYFSKNTPLELSNGICLRSGFEQVACLRKYLGTLLLNGRITNDTLNFVVDNVKNHLTDWKILNLSLAG